MPIIDVSINTLVTDGALFEDIDDVVLLGVQAKSSAVQFSDVDEFSALGLLGVAGVADFSDLDEFTADGFLNNEPNVFGEGIFDDVDEFIADPIQSVDALADFEDIAEFISEGVLLQAETPVLTFIFDVIGTEAELLADRRTNWVPRLQVDGVDVRIASAHLDDTNDQAGKTVDVNLVNLDERALFTSAASIRFGYGRRVSGAWDETTMEWEIIGGKAASQSSTTSGPPHTPADTVKITARDNTKTLLLKTAQTPLIIYDSNRVTVDTSQMDVLLDTDGRSYPTEALAIAGMTLKKLLTETLVNRCGFTSFRMNLPDYPLQRYDCAIGASIWQATKKFTGMFNPAVLDVNQELWIVDTSLAIPAGFPDPREVSFDQMNTVTSDEDVPHIDGFLVQYVQTDNAYDYTTFRFEDDTVPIGNTIVESNRIFIQFRKLAHPTVVLREALNIESKTISANGVTIEESTENWIYGLGGDIISRSKTVDKLLPTIGSFDQVPAPLSMQRSLTEYETYTYLTHPFKVGEKYIERRSLTVTGLIASDTQNPQLGRPWDGAFHSVYQTGNLNATTTVRDGGIRTYSESSTPLRNGNVQTRVFEVDEIVGLVLKDYIEERPGDVGMRATANAQKELLVLAEDNITRTTDEIQDFPVGELPLTLAIPLSRRVIVQRQTKPKRFNGHLISYDKTIKKGLPIRAKQWRNAVSPTNVLITGRVIDSDSKGTYMTVTGREI